MKKTAILTGAGLAALLLSAPLAHPQAPKQHTYESFQIAPNSSFMDFKRIEPGTFLMGSEDEKRQKEDGPPHRVTLTRPFYIGKYEVTQSQWNQVMRQLTWNNPSHFGGRLTHPVENVSWLEVQEFIRKVNEFDGHRQIPASHGSRVGVRVPSRNHHEDVLGGRPRRQGYGLARVARGLPPRIAGPGRGEVSRTPGACSTCPETSSSSARTSSRPTRPASRATRSTWLGDLVVARGGDWFHAHGVDSETRRKYGNGRRAVLPRLPARPGDPRVATSPGGP